MQSAGQRRVLAVVIGGAAVAIALAWALGRVGEERGADLADDESAHEPREGMIRAQDLEHAGDPMAGEVGAARGLFADVVIEAFARQKAFSERLRGERLRWNQYPDEARLEIQGVSYPLQFLGSLLMTADGDAEWLWGWANEDWPPPLVSTSRAVRDHAAARGVAYLTERTLHDSRGPWQYVSALGIDAAFASEDPVVYLGLLAVGLTDARGYFTGSPAGRDDLVCVYVIPRGDHPAPSFTPETLGPNVLAALDRFAVYDEKRAICGYLRSHGCECEASESGVAGSCAGIEVEARFEGEFLSVLRVGDQLSRRNGL